MKSSKRGNDHIDLSRFNQAFFDECAEHLAEMERILLEINTGEPDDEQLNAIFRAAHSIKGGAGIFGFQDMTVVTHELESLLDLLRNHEINFTRTMVDLFLEAGDVINMQLAGHRDGAEVRQEAVALICMKLHQMVETGAGASQPEPEVASTIIEPPAVAPGSLQRCYELVFTPDPEIFKRGIRLENLFNELEELGEVTIKADLASMPEFSSFDPELCVTTWNITLVTTASEAEIRDIFEFVAEEEQLTINELKNSADEPLPAPAEERAIAPEAASPLGRRAYDRNEMAPEAFGRRNGETDSSIRVNVAKVDQLINQVGELLITQAMLAQTAMALDPVQHEMLHRSVMQLERNTRDLQQSVMSIRLVPISMVFNRFPRMVRELAAKLGKEVEFRTIGDSTELDKGLIEKIADPLTHLIRNALDHGLETTEARVAAGKAPVGTIALRASQQGGKIVIEVMDDGAGLNRDKILRKAHEQQIPASETMSDEEVWQLIFAPGFSTAATVTDVSGRGVGMDVVLKNVQSIGGRVSVTSEAGKGARVIISLPLTLAILDGLSLAVGTEKYIIPLNAVIESLQPQSEQLKSVNGKMVLHVRGEYVPVVPLHELFHLHTAITAPEAGILVLVDVDGEKAAILVDALLDEHQVVIKNLETNYRKVAGSAGATILGDGRVALILDVTGLLQMWKTRLSA
jgi:two-component system chemotaxis sensor kinase CheA